MPHSQLRARVQRCRCDQSALDRHWSLTCPACPGDTFHCARLDDAIGLGSLHITRHRKGNR